MWSVHRRTFLPTGRFCMAKAGHWEPYELRGSRTVLGARGGEIPPRDSLAAVSPGGDLRAGGIDLDRSTMADWVGQTARLMRPLVDAVGAYVMSAERVHADDTTVPVLDPGRGKTKTGRLWCYARDDRHSAVRRRRRCCIATVRIARPNSARHTSPGSAASCRRMAMRAMPACMTAA